jgi:sRNA-binding protein
MTKNILAILLLSLAFTACESSPTDNNSNANKATPSATAQVPPATAASPSTEAAPLTAAQPKAGDRVKVMVNGSATEATVVSVDEKAGKVTIKVQGETKERTVNLAEIVKQ